MTDAKTGWHPVGSVIDIEQDEALKIIGRQQATPLDNGQPLPTTPSDEVKSPKLTKEERELAIKDLLPVKGIGEKNVDAIIDAGYLTIEDLLDVTEEQLAAIDRVTKANAKSIVKDVPTYFED
jgi:predicted flap endonuclease-1-like 5' DNA nuclease